VSKRFRTCDLDQVFLLPPSLQDWLPEKHLARFVADVTNALDLSKIIGIYGRKDGRGMAAYHPAMMVRVLLYGYCLGVVSSRKIERATYEDVAFRYLAADQHPITIPSPTFGRRICKAWRGCSPRLCSCAIRRA
jgi:transposase